MDRASKNVSNEFLRVAVAFFFFFTIYFIYLRSTDKKMFNYNNLFFFCCCSCLWLYKWFVLVYGKLNKRGGKCGIIYNGHTRSYRQHKTLSKRVVIEHDLFLFLSWVVGTGISRGEKKKNWYHSGGLFFFFLERNKK